VWVAANLLNKLLLVGDKEWASSLRVGQGASNSKVPQTLADSLE
jgi:hypothetical protein